MIKGALILATGFALGYAKAMSQTPELIEIFRNLKVEIVKNPDEPKDIDTTDTTEGEIVP